MQTVKMRREAEYQDQMITEKRSTPKCRLKVNMLHPTPDPGPEIEFLRGSRSFLYVSKVHNRPRILYFLAMWFAISPGIVPPEIRCWVMKLKLNVSVEKEYYQEGNV
jgi:hypothetical protein